MKYNQLAILPSADGLRYNMTYRPLKHERVTIPGGYSITRNTIIYNYKIPKARAVQLLTDWMKEEALNSIDRLQRTIEVINKIDISTGETSWK